MSGAELDYPGPAPEELDPPRRSSDPSQGVPDRKGRKRKWARKVFQGPFVYHPVKKEPGTSGIVRLPKRLPVTPIALPLRTTLEARLPSEVF